MGGKGLMAIAQGGLLISLASVNVWRLLVRGLLNIASMFCDLPFLLDLGGG